MGTAVELLKLPFRVFWFLVKLLVLPVVIVAGAYVVLGAGSLWFAGIALVCAGFAVLLVWLWWLRVCGLLRSLARGTGTVWVAGRGGGGGPRVAAPRRGGGRR
jgi:hypothetical protein